MAFSKLYRRRGAYRRKGRRYGRKRGRGSKASYLGRQLKSVAASSLKLQRSMQTHQAGRYVGDVTGHSFVLPLNATNIFSDAGTLNELSTYGHCGHRIGSSILLKRIQLDIEMKIDTSGGEYTGEPFRGRVMIVQMFNSQFADMSDPETIKTSLFENAAGHINDDYAGFRRTAIRGQSDYVAELAALKYKVIYDKMLMFSGNKQSEVVRFNKRWGLGKEPVIRYANANVHDGTDMFVEAASTGWDLIRNGYWIVLLKDTTTAGVFQLTINVLNDYCP